MNRADIEKRIAAVNWYHEFDFGDGLTTPVSDPFLHTHRANWEFIRRHLDGIDFRGKTVLDIGCWDGYWSFEAERRGAKAVLATDDTTQRWADDSGIFLAKELLRSNIDIDMARSVYDLGGMGRTFDVILYLGVYYHLHAPLVALAQIRKCCHPGTVVVMEGPITHGLPDGAALYNFPDHSCEWLPTLGAVRMLAEAAYFQVGTVELIAPADVHDAKASDDPLGWRYRFGMFADAIRGRRKPILDRAAAVAPHTPTAREAVNRLFMTLTPKDGVVPMHEYPAPFGLAAFDPRFRGKSGPE
jgi:tRNA (mo5U34)-methyltransferase